MNRRLSYSALKQFKLSPNHLLAYWNQEKEATKAMKIGSLADKMIFTPDESDYLVYDGIRRGKAWDAFLEEANGKDIFTVSEYDEAKAIKDAIYSNYYSKDILMRTNETQKEINWNFNGVDFKGYIDGVGDGFIYDLKTTTNASPDRFQRDAYSMLYHLQAAMYMYGVKCLGYDIKRYYIVAIENNSPYNVQVYELSPKMLNLGLDLYTQLTLDYIKWDGKEESYFDGILSLEPPKWVVDINEEDAIVM